MRVLAVLLVATLLVGLVPLGRAEASQPAIHPFVKANPVPYAKIQQTSTAEWSNSTLQNFWQNGSAQFATASTPAVYSMDLGVPFSAIDTTTVTLTVFMPSGLLPRVNVTQGSLFLANATIPFSIPLAAQVDNASNVVAYIVSAYTTTGATPSIAHYTAYSNLSRAITFENDSTGRWIQGPFGQWNVTYPLRAPANATLNNTVVFFPFPGNVTMNYSSLVASVGNRSLSSFQVSAGGVYVTIPGLARGKTLQLNVTGFPASVASVPPPLLPIHWFQPDGITAGYFTANASWFNNGSVPYAGAYVLDCFFPYPISTANFTLKANGHGIANGSLVIAGDRVTILANSWTTPVGSVTAFRLHFSFVGAPPTLSLANGQQIFAFGSTTITWGDFLLGVLVLIVVGAGIRLGSGGNSTKERARKSEEGYYFLAAFAIVALLLVAGEFL